MDPFMKQELAKNAYTNSIIDVFKRMVFYERRMDLWLMMLDYMFLQRPGI